MRALEGETTGGVLVRAAPVAGLEALAGAGFERGRTFHQMRIDTLTPPPPVEAPTGVMLRTFRPGQDEHAVYTVVEAAFDQPDRPPVSFEGWRDHMLRPEIFDPAIWLLAEDLVHRRLLGVCLCVDYPTGGWVRQLAVAPEAQGRGIGGALLRQAFAVFHARGVESVALSVESYRPDAHRFYQRQGMVESHRYDEHVRALQMDAGER